MRSLAPWLAGASLLALASPLTGQTALYVEHAGSFCLVREVRVQTPYVEENGKLVPEHSGKFTLQKIPEYEPTFVSISNLLIERWAMQSPTTGDWLNRELRFKADFESVYHLQHVFVALVLDTEEAGKAIFVQEVGELTPNETRWISGVVPINRDLGGGRFVLHLYADGQELIHSQMPFGVRERILDRLVARRLRGAPDGGPKPFVGPPPEYPKSLKRAKVAGKAVLVLRIAPNGSVQDPKVASATDPAFGASALEAVRLWRFLPKVKDGRPVEATIEMPFVFDPGSGKNER